MEKTGRAVENFKENSLSKESSTTSDVDVGLRVCPNCAFFSKDSTFNICPECGFIHASRATRLVV